MDSNIDIGKMRPAKPTSLDQDPELEVFEFPYIPVEYQIPGVYTYLNKPDVRVYDVAAYVLSKTGKISTMKLHKLLYYCQAWSLVWDESALFPETIEAWANGPVVKQFFPYHRGMFQISTIPIGNADLLSKKQKETVDSVIDFYGSKSSQWLVDLTHLEDPWKNARTGLEPLERGDREITHASMAEYYSSL